MWLEQNAKPYPTRIAEQKPCPTNTRRLPREFGLKKTKNGIRCDDQIEKG
jgi:hypothetical protein